MPHIYTKMLLLLRRFPPPSNTPVPRPTPLTSPNSIHIQSAVLPQYTIHTDRPADRLGNRFVPRPTYALYVDCSDTANNSNKKSQSNLEKPHRLHSCREWRTDSSAAYSSCALPTCRQIQPLSHGYATSTLQYRIPYCHEVLLATEFGRGI